MNKLEKLKMLQDRANIKIHGMNNYPKNSTCLIFTNHTCLMDIFYIPMILPDGKLISDIECINAYVQKQYKKTLENNSKILCRRLSR